MGGPMAANVAKAGHELLAYDTDAARLADFAAATGAGAAQSPSNSGHAKS